MIRVVDGEALDVVVYYAGVAKTSHVHHQGLVAASCKVHAETLQSPVLNSFKLALLLVLRLRLALLFLLLRAVLLLLLAKFALLL